MDRPFLASLTEYGLCYFHLNKSELDYYIITKTTGTHSPMCFLIFGFGLDRLVVGVEARV